MSRIVRIILVAVSAFLFLSPCVKAQNTSVAVPIDARGVVGTGGVAASTDTTKLGLDPELAKPVLPKQFRLTPFMEPMMSSGFNSVLFPETREEKAARYNKMALAALDESMQRNFNSDPTMPEYLTPVLMIASLFLRYPISIPYGYYPVMNQSNPFAITLIPGYAPEPGGDPKYSPENFPQTVSYEYDFRTGKYVAKMADMKTFKAYNAFDAGSFKTAPVPKVTVTPVERHMQHLY